jgi:hypothetical protein
MIATDHHLSDILHAICQMLDLQVPETFCSILLADAEGKLLLNGAARRPACRSSTARRFMEWPLVPRKEPAAPQRSGASW